MRSWLTFSGLLAVFAMAGCGGIPDPLPSEIADPAETYATSIRADVESLIEDAQDDPAGVADGAEALMESLEDTSQAGQYADTIGQIKEKVSALASGSGNVAELAELVAKLPGGETDGGDEPVQE